MNDTIGMTRPITMKKGKLFRHLALLCAAVGLGAAAGFGIVKATDGTETVTRYKTLVVSESPQPEFSIYLVRDQAQAEWLEGTWAGELGALPEHQWPAYRILVAGTPEQEMKANEVIEDAHNGGSVFFLQDLREHFGE